MDEQKIIDLEMGQDMNEVQIADDVIAVIAEIATLEVNGVVATAPSKADFMQALSGKKKSKGIKVEVGEGEVYIDIATIVKYGTKIHKVCVEIQEKVKNSVETMTGLHVATVNIHVVGVSFDKEQEA